MSRWIAGGGVATAGVTVVSAGANLATARPGSATVVYWKFSAGVDPGIAGENVVNAQPGDLFFVADA